MRECYHLSAKSRNKATGLMPVVSGNRSTCPLYCPMLVPHPETGEVGCYKEFGKQKVLIDHLDGMTDNSPRSWDGLAPVSVDDLCTRIEALRDAKYRPERVGSARKARFGGAGDLPHRGGRILRGAIRQLGRAFRRSNHVWELFTHHDISINGNVEALLELQNFGVAVNVSCQTLDEADRAVREGLDAALLRRDGWGAKVKTPDGTPVVQCRKQTVKGSTCLDCGWCWRIRRRFIPSFEPHGAGADTVRYVVELSYLAEEA